MRDEMMSGEALDVEIGRRVFGLDIFRCNAVHRVGIACQVIRYRVRPDDEPDHVSAEPALPRYSTDVAAAMTVFEAMVEMSGAGEIVADMEDARGEGFIVTVSFGFDEHVGTVTGPLPLAVCRAALAVAQAACATEPVS